jgi:hypothetical protein
MDYDLKCEGFLADEELEERLLLGCRRLLMAAGPSHPVRASLKQIDGRILARVEVFLSCRRLTAVVWRFDPEAALEAAVDVLMDSLLRPPVQEAIPRTWEGAGALSTLQ